MTESNLSIKLPNSCINATESWDAAAALESGFVGMFQLNPTDGYCKPTCGRVRFFYRNPASAPSNRLKQGRSSAYLALIRLLHGIHLGRRKKSSRS